MLRQFSRVELLWFDFDETVEDGGAEELVQGVDRHAMF
jgi:hypothetical protein